MPLAEGERCLFPKRQEDSSRSWSLDGYQYTKIIIINVESLRMLTVLQVYMECPLLRLVFQYSNSFIDILYPLQVARSAGEGRVLSVTIQVMNIDSRGLGRCSACDVRRLWVHRSKSRTRLLHSITGQRTGLRRDLRRNFSFLTMACVGFGREQNLLKPSNESPLILFVSRFADVSVLNAQGYESNKSRKLRVLTPNRVRTNLYCKYNKI